MAVLTAVTHHIELGETVFMAKTPKNAKAATFAKAQAISEMPAVCREEIVEATQTSGGQKAIGSNCPAGARNYPGRVHVLSSSVYM